MISTWSLLLRACFLNLPWETADRSGVRSGGRYPSLMKKQTNAYLTFPFPLAYAASYVESQGAESLLIDGCAERSTLDSVIERVQPFAPDLIVAELATASLAMDLASLERLREQVPGAAIAVFGSHTDVRPADALASSAVDFVIQGEPELTSFALMEAVAGGHDTSAIEGIAYRAPHGGVRENPRRALIPDVDALPYPKREGLPLHRYSVPGFPTPVVYLYGGRGCPFLCSFCLWPQTMLKGKYRARSGESMVDEMEWVLANYPETRSFYFDDDTFNLGHPRLYRFADEIERRGIRIPWGTNARADHWDRKLMTRLRDVGLMTLRIGIESGDPEVLARSRKNLDLDVARRTLSMARELGIKTHIGIIVGLPGESERSVENSIRFVRSVPVDSVQFSAATPFPGTEAYRQYEEKGHLLTSDFSKYNGYDHVVVRTDEMSAEQIGRALVRARRSIYFSPGFIFRRLGYVRDFGDLSASVRKALRLVRPGRSFDVGA